MSLPSSIANLFIGPWRAVFILGVTQIIAWGAIYYTPVLMVPLIAAERGWSKAFTMGGYSLGILTAGIFARFIGAYIDRFGGHRVMPFGSLLGAAGLLALPYAQSQLAYLAVWVVLGAAMAASLYDPAFATLGRIFGAAARQPITMLTLAGGLASTVSWPVTRVLIDAAGWQHTYLIYAALLLFVAAPLHALLPRTRAFVEPPSAVATPGAPALLQPRGLTFALVVLAFAVYAFVPSGLLAHLLAMFGRAGIDPSVAVIIGMCFGPCQTLARLGEFTFARNVHPIDVARFAVASLLVGFVLLGLFGLTTPIAILFMLLFGICNGLITLCRGTVPLALFGASGYGLTIGRIAGPALAIQSASPLVIAFVAERTSDLTAVALSATAVVLALICFLMIPRPAFTPRG
jgi:MFS family permease